MRKYASSVVEQNRKTYLNGERAKCIGVQRELEDLVCRSLRVNMQIQKSVGTTKSMLAVAVSRYEHKNRDVLLQLYVFFVRQDLEYYMQVRSSRLGKDIITIKGVQKRFTRLIPATCGEIEPTVPLLCRI